MPVRISTGPDGDEVEYTSPRPAGRPPIADPRTSLVRIRCTPEEHAELEARAGEAGTTMSELVRRLVWPA